MKLIAALFTLCVLAFAVAMTFMNGSGKIEVVNRGPQNMTTNSSATQSQSVHRSVEREESKAGMPIEAVESAEEKGTEQIDIKPAAILSLAKSAKQLNDAHYVIKRLSLDEQLSRMVDTIYPKLRSVLDNQKPAGAVGFFRDGEEEMSILAFAPIKDMQELTTVLKDFGNVKGKKPFVFEPPFGEPIFIKKKGQYAFASSKMSLLELAPNDPTVWLKDMPTKNNVSLKIRVADLPQQAKKSLIRYVREASPRSNSKISKPVFKQISELESVLLGINIEEFRDEIDIRLEMIGNEGSQLAAQSDACQAMQPTRFNGFTGKELPMSFGLCGGATEDYREMLNEWVDEFAKSIPSSKSKPNMDATTTAMLSEFQKQLKTLVKSSIESGTVDCGFKVEFVQDGKIQILGGAQIDDVTEFESFIKQSIQAAKLSPKKEFIGELDIQTGSDIRVHRVILEDESFVIRGQGYLAKRVELLFGFDNGAIYFGMGTSPLENLLAAIEQSKSDLENHAVDSDIAMRSNIGVASFFNALKPINRSSKTLKRIFAKSSGSDQVEFKVLEIENGFAYDFRIQTGLLADVAKAGRSKIGDPFAQETMTRKSPKSKSVTKKRSRNRNGSNMAPSFRPRLIETKPKDKSRMPFSKMKAVEQ